LGILLRYENVGYKVLINNKVIIARHVDIEENVNLRIRIGFKGNDEDDDYQDGARDPKFGSFTKNSKYIKVHYHFVHECVEEGMIDIVKIESENSIKFK